MQQDNDSKHIRYNRIAEKKSIKYCNGPVKGQTLISELVVGHRSWQFPLCIFEVHNETANALMKVVRKRVQDNILKA